MRPLPDQRELRRLLKYDPLTGKLFWRHRSPEMFSGGYRSAHEAARAWNARWAGKEAFTADRGNGYLQGCVFEHRLYAHRVIAVMVTGEWPEEVDHEDHDRKNNKLSNLRISSRAENCRNLKLSSTNTTGVCGVHFDKKRSLWLAYITAKGTRYHLGRFDTKSEAIAARWRAEEHHGFHANHGLSESSMT
ncbi:HNH endonuclease [Primorskyibacter flagellatus]|uniref:HNH endonuclease n=1 Tax=Primorskyibacter flagellatus TaxID=1387277 RepID=UPI003571105C